MNPLAEQLNAVLSSENNGAFSLLSEVGKALFFPKGILTQSAEAKEKAYKINATIGIAREKGDIMFLPSAMKGMDYPAEEILSYASSFGIPELRHIWRQAILEKNPSLSGKSFSLPVVTCGITHAISLFSEIWCNPGDTVILPDMIWGNYNLIMNVRLGIGLRHYPTFNEKGGFHVEAFARVMADEAEQKGKAIALLNFPQNPTGYSLSRSEAFAIRDVLLDLAQKGKKVLAVLDDAYFGLFYEDETFKESLFALLADLHPNILAIKLDGATKENFAWGLRIGFISYSTKIEKNAEAFYEALERKTAGCIRGNISNASHAGQYIVLQSMKDPNYKKEHEEKRVILSRRANLVKEVLLDPKYGEAFIPYPFNSGYFMCVRLKDVDAEKLRVHLLKNYGVGLIALGKTDIRIAFSCIEVEDIRPLFDILLQGVQDLKG
ncbi:aminotransferase class I/II-fold pyridoxal phosphate-dependent enzyme [Desulfococcaceae bacterium OttesenSCG-928-F15]|nr:aminotransferase class I/II-fold pyridoxal phosphate-dependent enzyme [Desulfococcaceae bacterium OttesenSCG-928-F15]